MKIFLRLAALTFFLLYSVCTVWSQEIRIGLFNENSIQTFLISPLKGSFAVSSDSSILFEIRPGSVMYVSLLNNQLSVRDIHITTIMVSRLRIFSQDSSALFSLRPAFPALPARIYEGDCSFVPGIGRIQAVNELSEARYLAAVIVAEAGTTSLPEFYKAQAVLCRTYLLANTMRHETDGFNLCDGVHCQAYLGMNDKNPAILGAVLSTDHQVAVYNDTILITAAFHSNCGGETQNSENEWLQVVPYLRSVKDPYCQNSRNGKWELTIEREKWLEYLRKCGMKVNDPERPDVYDFILDSRRPYYLVGTDSIAFRKIRNDWGLKSSFISIQADSTGNIILHGRGYGHGIGLCQQGAMNMASRGLSYVEILKFYFRDIRIRDADQVRSLKVSHYIFSLVKRN